MKVKEVIRVQDGRAITINVNEAEHSAILNAGFNFLVAQGLLSVDATDSTERLATEELNEELDASEQESHESTKH